MIVGHTVTTEQTLQDRMKKQVLEDGAKATMNCCTGCTNAAQFLLVLDRYINCVCSRRLGGAVQQISRHR